MDDKVRRSLLIQQIHVLADLISERDENFVRMEDSVLESLSTPDLSQVKRGYHELAYTPPV